MQRLLNKAVLPVLLIAGAQSSIFAAGTSAEAHAVAAQAATASTSSFVLTASPATQVTKPARANQAYSKQWSVSADADSKIPAIEALALDLPGQVFVTYARASSVKGAASLVGTVKVFGAIAALVDSVRKKWNYPNARWGNLRKLQSDESSVSTRDAARPVTNLPDADRRVSQNWTILTPKTDKATYSFDLQVSGLGFARINRVDMGVAGGEVEVATYVESGRDVLHIAPRNGSAIPNSGNTSIEINLAPNVNVANLPTSPSASNTSVKVWGDLNKPFPSDAVTLFVNGTGDLFVLANKSAVYVADFTVRVAGSGRSQTQIRDVGSVAGVTLARDFYGGLTTFGLHTNHATVIEASNMCLWMANENRNERFIAGTTWDTELCKTEQVPVKFGGSPSAAAPGQQSAARGVAAPLYGALLAMIAVAVLCAAVVHDLERRVARRRLEPVVRWVVHAVALGHVEQVRMTRVRQAVRVAEVHERTVQRHEVAYT
ncbi:hypothetical protein PybrP1_012202 [[Pythium] brassicae (nom. inval.)]|nr:hypothetical protein PybrP1_012202 [[Pythium] brassicae (nom. inval.)]